MKKVLKKKIALAIFVCSFHGFSVHFECFLQLGMELDTVARSTCTHIAKRIPGLWLSDRAIASSWLMVSNVTISWLNYNGVKENKKSTPPFQENVLIFAIRCNVDY